MACLCPGQKGTDAFTEALSRLWLLSHWLKRLQRRLGKITCSFFQLLGWKGVKEKLKIHVKWKRMHAYHIFINEGSGQSRQTGWRVDALGGRLVQPLHPVGMLPEAVPLVFLFPGLWFHWPTHLPADTGLASSCLSACLDVLMMWPSCIVTWCGLQTLITTNLSGWAMSTSQQVWPGTQGQLVGHGSSTEGFLISFSASGWRSLGSSPELTVLPPTAVLLPAVLGIQMALNKYLMDKLTFLVTDQRCVTYYEMCQESHSVVCPVSTLVI